MGRRDKDDLEWQAVKKFVFDRDKNKCRFMSTISAKEANQIRKIAPAPMLRILDPAHVIGVGPCPHLCYEARNIVTLCRWVHDCLDNCKSPFTGGNITREERDKFWVRIVGSMTYGTLQEMKKPQYKQQNELINGEDAKNE